MNSDKLKNLTIRTLSGAVLAALLFGATLLSPWGYVALLAVIVVVGVWEFYSLCEACGYAPQKVMGVTLSVLLFAFGASVFSSVVIERSIVAESIILAAIL